MSCLAHEMKSRVAEERLRDAPAATPRYLRSEFALVKRGWAVLVLLVLLLAASAALAAPRKVGTASFDQARTAFAAADYTTALATLDALGPQGALAPALELRARIELATGRYAEAAATARRAGRLGRGAEVSAAPWLAEALRRSGKRDEAIDALRKVESEPAARRARLVLGELLIETGKRAEAEQPLMTIVTDYNNDAIDGDDPEGLSLVGRAAHLLRSPRDANDAFNEAERVGGKRRVETLLWRAELYLDKYDPGHAAQVVKEALALAPNHPRARVAMAEVKLAQTLDFAAADKEVALALAVDPRLAEAHFVRAGLALRTMDLDAALAAADAGLRTDPRSLELLSIKAAARFLADEPAAYEALERQVLGLNPGYARFYLIVGDYADWEHRYADIVAMMRKATSVDPMDAKAYATLGINLIRSGDEPAGVEELRKAWRRDPYNVRVFNTLDLYEKIIAKQYVTTDGAVFRIRYHKRDKPILERYAPQLLERAWTSMVRRYGFRPKTPVGIELYADPEHFSVRTSGLPNVGIQGVCFGRTLAALSPTAGPFNWGMILWHELAHVFAIEQSHSRVPRWFTEGLSEYETVVARPEWRREDALALFRGLRENRIPAVASFNRAFTHAENPEDITTAYFAASQIMLFLVEEFGFEKVVAALPLFGASRPGPAVVERAFGVSAADIDARFRRWLEPRIARYRHQYVPDLREPDSLDEARKALAADPKNPDLLVKVALGLLAGGKRAEALATVRIALDQSPKHADALYLDLKLALREEDLERAQARVRQLVSAGHDGYAVRMRGADIAEQRKEPETMKAELWAAHKLDPSQAEPLQALADLARKAEDRDGEIAALRMLAQVDQHDRRVWKRLLEGLVRAGEWAEARTVGESALFVAVDDPEVHRLYGRALARSGQFVSAIYELNSALVAGAKASDAAAIYASMAEGYRKLGRVDYAEQAESHAAAVREKAQRAKALGSEPDSRSGAAPMRD